MIFEYNLFIIVQVSYGLSVGKWPIQIWPIIPTSFSFNLCEPVLRLLAQQFENHEIMKETSLLHPSVNEQTMYPFYLFFKFRNFRLHHKGSSIPASQTSHSSDKGNFNNLPAVIYVRGNHLQEIIRPSGRKATSVGSQKVSGLHRLLPC